jgi:hypothetical protein
MWSPSTGRRRSDQIPANRWPGPAGRRRGTTLRSWGSIPMLGWVGRGPARGAPAAVAAATAVPAMLHLPRGKGQFGRLGWRSTVVIMRSIWSGVAWGRELPVQAAMVARRASRHTRGGGGEQALKAAGGRGVPCFAVKACPTLKPCVRRPDVDRHAHAGRGTTMVRRVKRWRGQGGHGIRVASVCAWPGEGAASGCGPWARMPRGRHWRAAALWRVATSRRGVVPNAKVLT